MPETEADTCRRRVLPKLYAAGWDDDRINEQRSFTDGRVVVIGGRVRRRRQKRADYILRYTRDFPLAIVEAKACYHRATDGLQQAKEYAEILDLKFAYATNGHEIVEFDFTTGRETPVSGFPKPDELWTRWRKAQAIRDNQAAERLLTPSHHQPRRSPHYYQEIAINRVLTAILDGRRRVLVTMATGTGKTTVAFQVCWKLWNARWNRTGEHRRPKILYLADRNVLVDQPILKDFAPFKDALFKIENGQAPLSREMYFAIYQALAKDERRPGLYREYRPDFFDLVIVDECHRGSARDESSWREILEYFEPAFQLGMTATPKRHDNIDTYRYFGEPLYQYSLRSGIDDGFLAPYRVHRVITNWDAAGWRPSQGDLDRFGRTIPDEEYQTRDFERAVALKARTLAIARHLTDFMKKHDRHAKTIVFCVDQEHADEMRQVLSNLNDDLVRQFPDYVCRVTSDEGQIGRGYLDKFADIETESPVILTTSQMLTTGIDAPTCKNVVLARVINSMIEFKQIIGRGTRLCTDYDKFFFNIVDYTNSTRLFADPAFDGDPVQVVEVPIDDEGQEGTQEVEDFEQSAEPGEELDAEPVDPVGLADDDRGGVPRKFYFDGGQVNIAAHLVYELDPDGRQLRVVSYTDYTADAVRTLCGGVTELRRRWADSGQRAEIIEQLGERGIDFDELAQAANQPQADPFDLLCHVAFNAPLRTRRERAERLRKEKKDFFDQYGPEAQTILNMLLDKYAEHGTAQFALPDILEVPPLSERGNIVEIADRFGGTERLRDAVNELQTLLYAA